MSTASTSLSFKTLALGFAGAATLLAVALMAYQSSAASETVLVRGIVKEGGAKDSVNLYITNVTTSADASKIRGVRTDVNVTKAKKYKWIVTKGTLSKVRTTSNPVPGQEIVVKGTLLDDGRITAAWMVTNYRQFTVTGKLQNRTLDSNKTDQGYITVNVTSSVMKDVIPTRLFKEEAIKGKDVKFRVEATTSVNALGKSKSFEEVNAGQQTVKLDGEIMNNSDWIVTKLNEYDK